MSRPGVATRRVTPLRSRAFSCTRFSPPITSPGTCVAGVPGIASAESSCVAGRPGIASAASSCVAGRPGNASSASRCVAGVPGIASAASSCIAGRLGNASAASSPRLALHRRSPLWATGTQMGAATLQLLMQYLERDKGPVTHTHYLPPTPHTLQGPRRGVNR